MRLRTLKTKIITEATSDLLQDHLNKFLAGLLDDTEGNHDKEAEFVDSILNVDGTNFVVIVYYTE